MASLEDPTPVADASEAEATVEGTSDTIPAGIESSADEKPTNVADTAKEDTAPSSPEKTTTGPKRPVAAAAPKRPTTSTATKTTKLTSATTRPATGSSLNKPPIRPTATSTTRKTAAPTTTVRRTRPSISSSADEKGRGVVSSSDESRRVGITGAAKRTSMSGTTSSRLAGKSSLGSDRRSTITQSTTDRKSTTSRASPSTPSKTTSRTPAVGSGTPRSTRTTTTTASRSSASVDLTKKRTGTPASPVTKRGSVERAPPTRLTSKTPALQQQITEYETIRALFQAAVAAEEVGDEAKRVEIQNNIDRDISKLKTTVDAMKQSKDGEGSEETSNLQPQLEASEQKIAELQAALDEARVKMADLEKSGSEASAVATKVEELTDAHVQELKTLQEKLDLLESKNEDIIAQSTKDVENARQAATEQENSKVSELLEEQRQTNAAAMEKLENDLTTERDTMAELANQIETLKAEIATRGEELAAAKQLANEAENTTRELQEEKVQSYETQLESRDSVIKGLEEDLSQKHSNEKDLLEARETDANRILSLEEKLAHAESQTAQGTEETSKTIAEQENELDRLGKLIEQFQNDIQELHESKSNELDKQNIDLRTTHERALATLQAEHDSTVANLTANHNLERTQAEDSAQSSKETMTQEITQLTQKHEEAELELQNKVNELNSETSRLQSEVEAISTGQTAELQELKQKLAETEQALADSKSAAEQQSTEAQEGATAQIKALEDKLQSLETELAEEKSGLQTLTTELETEKAQVTGLQKGLEAFEADGKEKDEHHDSIVKALSADAEAAAKSLEEKLREISSMEEQHSQALEDSKKLGSTEIDELQAKLTESQDRAEKLQILFDELTATKDEAELAYTQKTESLKSEHALALEEQVSKLSSLSEAHDEKMAELEKDMEQSIRTKLSEEFEQSQNQKRQELEADQSKAIEELLNAQEEKLNNLREKLESASKEKLAAAESAHSNAVAELQEELEKAKESAADTSAIDSLKVELTELKASHSAELTQVRQEKAEVEEALKTSRTATAESEVLQSELDATKQQLSTVNDELSQQKEAHEKLLDDLESLTTAASASEQKNKDFEAQLSSIESDMNALGGKNVSLVEQLQESQTSISKCNRRIRELEFDLADSQKGKTESPGLANGAEAGPTGGIDGSRWASADDEMSQKDEAGDKRLQEDAGPAATEGEDLGSSIEGTMASIREQLRQLEEVNEAMFDDNARFVNTILSKVTQNTSPQAGSPRSPSVVDAGGAAGEAAESRPGPA